MELKISAPVVIAIILLAVIVGGELIIMTSGHDDFNSGITPNSDSIGVDVDVNGSHIVTIVSMENSFDSPEKVYIYYDKNYESAYNDVQVAAGARSLTQESYVKMLVETLRVRSVSSAELVNASQLADVMASGRDDIAIVCLSGALPDTVYDGTPDSKILEWISNGGRFYWAGNVLGKYIAHVGNVEEIENGVSLFFGTECIDDSRTESYKKHLGSELTEGLSIINNNTEYSPDISNLPSGTDYQVFGYTDGHRYSAIVAEHGEGSICIVGGDYSDYQRIDLAQIIASGISPWTEVVSVLEESVRGTDTFLVDKCETMYVYFGGDLTIYGKLHEVSA